MCAQMYSTEGEASPRGPPYTTSLSTATLTAQPNSALHPVYRVLDTSGKVIDPSQEPQVLASTCLYSFSLLYCVLVTIRNLLLVHVLVDLLKTCMCTGLFTAEQGITGEDVPTDGDPVNHGPASLQSTENGKKQL